MVQSALPCRGRLIAALAIIACVIAFSVASASPNCTSAIPDENAGTTPCEYLHVPFATFAYAGNLRSTWGTDLQVLEMNVVADWGVVAEYVPGTILALPIDTTKARYDFVGRFRRLSTGEEFTGITPIWCVRSANLPAPLEGCFSATIGMDDCKITETKTCGDGSTKTVTCEGDSGTCKGNPEGYNGAQCTSSTTKTTTSTDGTKTTSTEITKKESPC